MIVAGDASLPVWDNAADALTVKLEAAGTPAADINRLSAADSVIARPDVGSASRDRVLNTIAGLRPGPDQGCLVFLTAHGARGQGLVLARTREFLSPDALDRALLGGCAAAPTVAVVSGCYTGDFAAPPMARDHRIVLTASRADRVSFGCGAKNTLTEFDDCFLRAIDTGGTWTAIMGRIRPCVAEREAAQSYPQSLPQLYVGAAVAELSGPSAIR